MPARLVKVSRSDLAIRRHKQGRGFCYRDADGVLVCDPEFRSRVKLLAIPPAWREVHIAAHPRAHIQVVGIDDAGRQQYLYHPDWEERRTARKQQRLTQMTAALPRVRRKVAQLLKSPPGSRELAIAIAVALIDRTGMRVGREKYLESNGTRGAGTLYSRDVQVEGSKIALKFPAKSGKIAEYELTDAPLAAAIGGIMTLPGKRLLVYRTPTGKVKPLKTAMINEFLHNVSGAEISAKDFRTLHASAMAAEALAGLPPGTSMSARKRQIAGVVRGVAEFLHNTPTVSRKSYIAPCLFKLFDDGKLSALWEAAAARQSRGLLPREHRLAVVLGSAG